MYRKSIISNYSTMPVNKKIFHYFVRSKISYKLHKSHKLARLTPVTPSILAVSFINMLHLKRKLDLPFITLSVIIARGYV